MRSHLLVATDFSVPAQHMTRSLEHLRTYGADTITLVHIQPSPAPWISATEDRDYAEERLREVADDLEGHGWTVDVRHETGRPGSRIVELADEVDADLIALANQGHGATAEVVLGSVAADVLERADKPIFLFCADAVDDPEALATVPLWDRLICPIDFSEPSSRALSWATEIATTEWTPLMLVHAVDDRFHGERETEKRRRRLDALAEEVRGEGVRQVETEVVRGRPKKVIVEAGDHYPGALFVMGTHGRGWLGDLMLGGTSRAVARRGTHHALFIPGR